MSLSVLMFMQIVRVTILQKLRWPLTNSMLYVNDKWNEKSLEYT